MKIAILTGGISTERDVSLQTGRCIEQALLKAGYEVVFADINPDSLDILDDTSIDIFFPALHGEFGEDGRLQQILEDKNLCYVGSGPKASALAMDKVAAKEHFTTAGAITPCSVRYSDQLTDEKLEEELSSPEKYVVKPITHGSSVGVEIVSLATEAISLAADCNKQYGNCMVEQFVEGREITVGILNGKALPIIEVIPKENFYDYHAKYIADSTEYLFDTITDKALIEKINHDAIACFELLGCRHFGRIDFLLTEDNVPYVLEINTIPGMTTHSLVPKAAAKTGLSMSKLCSLLVKAAIDDNKENSLYKITETYGQTKIEKKQISQEA